MNTPIEFQNALQDYFIDSSQKTLSAIPDNLKKKLKTFTRASKLANDATVGAVETIYAQRTDVDDDLIQLAYEGSQIITTFNIYGMGSRSCRLEEVFKAMIDHKALPDVMLDPLDIYIVEEEAN